MVGCSLMTRSAIPGGKRKAARYTTARTRSGIASATAVTVRPPSEWPTRTTGLSPSSRVNQGNHCARAILLPDISVG